VALVKRYDAEFPKKHLEWALDYMGISEEFLWQVINFYRSRSNVWEEVEGEWVMTRPVS
jgi:hypothetical protein